MPTTTEVPSVEVGVERGFTYRETVSDDSTPGGGSKVEVYVPDLPGDRPAVVLLHGWGDPNGRMEFTPLTTLADEIARLGATVFYFKWDTYGGFTSRSADDLSCMGSFVAARAAEFGARSDRVLIVGHSMGADQGSSLAFRSFEIPRAADCTESDPQPVAAAFLGIGGSYGWNGQPAASNPEALLVRSGCSGDTREVAPTEVVRFGLTAQESFELGGYGSMHLTPDDLRVVLLVGTLDPNICTSADVTRDFSAALDSVGVVHELIEVEGAGHEDVVNPNSEPGKNTLRIIEGILAEMAG